METSIEEKVKEIIVKMVGNHPSPYSCIIDRCVKESCSLRNTLELVTNETPVKEFKNPENAAAMLTLAYLFKYLGNAKTPKDLEFKDNVAKNIQQYLDCYKVDREGGLYKMVSKNLTRLKQNE